MAVSSIKKKIVFLFVIPLLFCFIVMLYAHYQTKINCYNDGMIKKCLVEQNTLIKMSFLKEWEGEISKIEFTSKLIKDGKTTQFSYRRPATIRSSRIAVSRNQIILHGTDNTGYHMTLEDFYLVAKPYDKIMQDINNFNENKIQSFSYKFTNTMGFIYAGFLLLGYYAFILFWVIKKR